MESRAFRAWSFLSLDRTKFGAPSYPDELGARYVYDTTVANGRHVQVGDLAVIRDNRIVYGAGWIDDIDVMPGRKIRHRCPNCGSADIKPRSTRRPEFRCNACADEFDAPADQEVSVEVFTANYSRTWRLADDDFPEQALDSAYIARSQQHAVRELAPAKLRPILEAHLVTGAPWWSSLVREETRIPGGHGLALAKTRLGQQRFREAMLSRFNATCAFTGPQPAGALEAAHLNLFSKDPRHDLRAGLLLRRDLHALFDRWLITIDPEHWLIRVAPDLYKYPGLAELHGMPVLIPPELRPSEEYVQTHAAISYATWDHREVVSNGTL